MMQMEMNLAQVPATTRKLWEVKILTITMLPDAQVSLCVVQARDNI